MPVHSKGAMQHASPLFSSRSDVSGTSEMSWEINTNVDELCLTDLTYDFSPHLLAVDRR